MGTITRRSLFVTTAITPVAALLGCSAVTPAPGPSPTPAPSLDSITILDAVATGVMGVVDKLGLNTGIVATVEGYAQQALSLAGQIATVLKTGGSIASLLASGGGIIRSIVTAVSGSPLAGNLVADLLALLPLFGVAAPAKFALRARAVSPVQALQNLQNAAHGVVP